MSEIKITKDNFRQEVLESPIPVLVDFWATWCGPCRMLAPTLTDLAEDYAGRVKVGKINIDEEPELARQFGIMSIPTVKLFRGGQAVDTVVGLHPREDYDTVINL